mmetsp:Transcript_17115/g.39550  ORF Transcript_17115/g.39550 Transcript_17115/m.39550 type:complete len:226 (+) Transcript_17115:563-1240(+)
MPAQVVHVHLHVVARPERAHLRGGKETQPARVQHPHQSAVYRARLCADLPVEVEVRDQVNVLYPVGVVDGDGRAAGPQLNTHLRAQPLHVDGEGEAEVRHIPRVCAHECERGVKLRVEFGQLVNGRGPSQHAPDEKGRQRHVERDTLVERLSQHPPNKLVEVFGILVQCRGVRVCVEVLAVQSGDEEAKVARQRPADHSFHKLLEDTVVINTRLAQPQLAHEAHA